MKFSAALSLVLAAAAFANDTVLCDTDSRGVETITTLWDTPRPMAYPSMPFGQRDAQFVSVNVAPEGDLPREVAVTPDGTTALVINLGTLPLSGGTISFVDVATRTVTGSVGVGQFPVSIAISPNGQYAVTTNVLSNDVSVVHIPTRTLLANVPVTGTQPIHVQITPDSTKAIVGVTNDAINSTFSVIDLATQTQVNSFPGGSQGTIGFYGTPEFAINGTLHTYFALTPDGSRIVMPISATSGSRVAIYDIATGTETSSIPVSAAPRSIDIAADGSIAVVGHETGTGQVSVINLVTNTLANAWPTGNTPQSQVIRVTPNKSHAIVAISNNVIFLNLTTGVVDTVLSTGVVGDILIVDPNTAFITNFNSSVVDIPTRTITRTLTLNPTVEAAVVNTNPRKVVGLNSRFREDIHFYTINGANSTADGFVASGPAPEGDCTKPLAVSPDGSTIVAGNTISRNASIIDAATGNIRATVNTGDRVSGVAITPDNHTAVVANSDSNTVSIIDLTTNIRVAQLNVDTRPWHVAMHPSGTLAAVLTVAGTDQIHFININGASSSVIGTAIAGQTGNIGSYAYFETSGIAFSPDGSMLAVCRSFDDLVRLINTNTRAIIADVVVGDFPMRIGFTPDGTKAFVTNAFSNDISVLAVNGASTVRTATIPGMNSPLSALVDSAGEFVYVNNNATAPRISVINASTNAVVANVALPDTGIPRDIVLGAPGTDKLFVAGSTNNGGRAWILNATGPSSSVQETINLSGSPFNIAYSPNAGGVVAISQPTPDGVDLIRLGPPPILCDSIDFNNDTSLFDPQDIEAFLSVYSEGPCVPSTATCNDIDFNNDTSIFDPCDINSFLVMYSEGPCTPCGV
ncbi:MAG: YncE family protein [Phycisphaerales bacterium]